MDFHKKNSKASHPKDQANVISNAFFITSQPYATGKLIYYFNSTQTDMSRQNAYYYGTALVGINMVNCIFLYNYNLMVAGLGIKIRGAVGSLLLRKVLKLNLMDVDDAFLGQIVTLITKDVYTIQAFVEIGNEIWIAFVTTVVVVALLYIKIGMASLVTVVIYVIFIVIQVIGCIKITSCKRRVCREADARYQNLEEILSSIRTVKMYAWEKFFESTITGKRRKEIRATQDLMITRTVLLSILYFSCQTNIILTLLAYKRLENDMSSDTVYYTITSLYLLSITVNNNFSKGLSAAAELIPCLKRIQHFLCRSEAATETRPSTNPITPQIKVTNVNLKISNKYILQNVNVHIKQGLYVLTGPVNSGKTSFLKLILEEYKQQTGNVDIQGSISYASQETWLFPSTVKQNILFGEEYDPQRYRQVIKVCALSYDFELLENGDMTIVGGEGSNLSKGQQTRICLARTVYRNRDIYLLDSCFSRLDPQVGLFIFQECIQKFLENKLVILVTDNLIHIGSCNYIMNLTDCRIDVKSQDGPTKIKYNPDESETLTYSKQEKSEDDYATEDMQLIKHNVKVKQIYNEQSKFGVVSKDVYYYYIRNGGGYLRFLLMLCCFGGWQTGSVFGKKYISEWTHIEDIILNYNSTNVTNLTFHELSEKRDNIMYILILVLVAKSALDLLRIACLFLFCIKSSVTLHENMLTNIFNVPLNFFDKHFIGSILNRFSKDFAVVDEMLPMNLFSFLTNLLSAAGPLVLVISVNAVLMVPTAILFILLMTLKKYYNKAAGNLRRLEAIAKSPVVGYFDATVKGLATVKVFKMETFLLHEFDEHQDVYNSASYSVQCCASAFTFALSILQVMFVGVVIFTFLLIGQGNTSDATISLVIFQATVVVSLMQDILRYWAELQNKMTSVERIMEYTEYQKEAGKDYSSIEKWPVRGEIKYERVSLSYGNSMEKTLNDVSFSINSREKVAVVGRTGAGKTSIISSLFRLYEAEGHILIDGVDIKTISPKFLRSHIATVPQDVFIFSGTIRGNIDPLGKHTDHEIWTAIESAKLKNSISSLDLKIANKSTSLSAGEKQLISLIRAILSKNKIVVLDEASANLDPYHDLILRSTILENFASSTVLLITHKLQLALECDKVLVMNKGEIVEFGKPMRLLQDKTSLFYIIFQCSDVAT